LTGKAASGIRETGSLEGSHGGRAFKISLCTREKLFSGQAHERVLGSGDGGETGDAEDDD